MNKVSTRIANMMQTMTMRITIQGVGDTPTAYASDGWINAEMNILQLENKSKSLEDCFAKIAIYS
jgi:hypothetical protein